MTAVPTNVVENLRKAWMPFESDMDVTRVFSMTLVGTAVITKKSVIHELIHGRVVTTRPTLDELVHYVCHTEQAQHIGGNLIEYDACTQQGTFCLIK